MFCLSSDALERLTGTFTNEDKRFVKEVFFFSNWLNRLKRSNWELLERKANVCLYVFFVGFSTIHNNCCSHLYTIYYKIEWMIEWVCVWLILLLEFIFYWIVVTQFDIQISLPHHFKIVSLNLIDKICVVRALNRFPLQITICGFRCVCVFFVWFFGFSDVIETCGGYGIIYRK